MCDYSKDLKDLKILYEHNKGSGILLAQIVVPWPLQTRDMCIKTSTIQDPHNKCILQITKSLEVGEKYFD